MPKKRTGEKGAIEIGPEGANAENIAFPEAKEQIEQYVAENFVRHPPKGEDDQFVADSLRQNQQNDLDFHVDTKDGDKLLELMEFAPLDKFGGSFDNIPSQHNVGEISDWYCQEVLRKSAKYQRVPNVYLLTYVTERTLNLRGCLRLIGSKLNRSQLSLERVYYISLHGSTGASSIRLYPIAGTVLPHADEERFGAMTLRVPRREEMRVTDKGVEIPWQPVRSDGNDDG